MIPRSLLLGFLLIFIFSEAEGRYAKLSDSSSSNGDVSSLFESTSRQLMEQGRTLVRRTLKRFMIILPAIFFKLGIAFTLLILVALAVVSNGFIGFMILVVGLSSVLSRLQIPSTSPVVPVPYVSPVQYQHAAQVWNRNDNENDGHTKLPMGQNQAYNYPQLNGYYATSRYPPQTKH